MRIIYYVYGSTETPPTPLTAGTAIYASVQRENLPEVNVKWNGHEWEASNYLGHLRRTGSTGLDNIQAEDLPPNVPPVENFLAQL